ncbi:glycosyltransferase [uncultured Algibacter sp.]|uniref:glycosyltransferase n=1 Tax=uncultured Algibacter sp. TaxID=298659 RepID=UPI002610C76A|nr:glycosyltransferase [uncultured Algibacter sp.]
MYTTFELIIVLPCYNESKRIQLNKYHHFIKNNPKVMLCFVNDGSTDVTMNYLKFLNSNHPTQSHIIDLKDNRGKAEAVKMGIISCLETFMFKNIAYLDADLSTSLEECWTISNQLTSNVTFAFGSRIAKLDASIDRKKYRFIIGRCLATLISKQLNLKVYDTQCGCKIFERSLAAQLFKEKFVSKWLFDVELFHRLLFLYGKDKLVEKVKEVPLNSWIDTPDSKVPLTYFFKLWIDLILIKYTYKVPAQSSEIKNEAVYE